MISDQIADNPEDPPPLAQQLLTQVPITIKARFCLRFCTLLTISTRTMTKKKRNKTLTRMLPYGIGDSPVQNRELSSVMELDLASRALAPRKETEKLCHDV